MFGTYIKSGLTVLGLGATLVLGPGSWGMAAASQAPLQSYTGQIESIKIDQCGEQPGTCAGTLVLAQPRGQEVTVAMPAGATVQRGAERVYLEQLGIGNYITVQAPRPAGHRRTWTWGEIDAYEQSPINSGNQGGGDGGF